jgi:hypothetical protein
VEETEVGEATCTGPAPFEPGRTVGRRPRTVPEANLLLQERECPARLISIMKRRKASMSIEQRETVSLIGSDKVEGTAVYGRDEEKIGSIDHLMIDKQSGKVAYAVISYGGFLGVGDDHYPTPWSSLKYDTRLGGYVVGITADALKDAPRYANDNGRAWSRENDERVYGYYKTAPYWGVV